MDLILTRTNISSACTMGRLSIAGTDFSVCTLEPPKQLEKPRAIPDGTYRIILNESPRLAYITPLLLDVPDFSDVRMHIGNYPQDTEGCILVGESANVNSINNSKEAFQSLMGMLKDSQSIILTIIG